ncbi:hypothetical protein LINPERHAP2_LOCUS14535 [Linum perenne]
MAWCHALKQLSLTKCRVATPMFCAGVRVGHR